jgi:thioredoxin reductase (NADPH)
MRQHALKFGLEIQGAEMSGLRRDEEAGLVVLDTPEGELRAKTAILCLGASPKKLGIPGELEMTGRGVSYCGTCDGPFYREQEVACVGGGDTAAEEAVFLTKFAKKVYLVHRRDELRARGVLAERVLGNEKIEVLWSQVPLAITGENGVEAMRLQRVEDLSEYDLAVQGAFIFVGTDPNTQALHGAVETDSWGFIVTDQDQRTSLSGVFAAGDCCSKLLRQIVTAAGEGATAAYAAQRYLEESQ